MKVPFFERTPIMSDNPYRVNAEVKLRGTALAASVSIETIIVDAIYCNNAEYFVDGDNHPALKLKGLTFKGKVARLKVELQKNHSDLLGKYETLFTDLETFIETRNKLAHCAFEWLDDKLGKLNIWDIHVESNKSQFYAPKEYTTWELAETISVQFGKIVTPLASLHNEVDSRLAISHPAIYAAVALVRRKPDL